MEGFTDDYYLEYGTVTLKVDEYSPDEHLSCRHGNEQPRVYRYYFGWQTVDHDVYACRKLIPK